MATTEEERIEAMKTKKAPSPVGGKGARGVKDKAMSKPKRTFPPDSKPPAMPQSVARNVLGNK